MYIPVIGLEIHLQVKTNSKMFCRCSTDYFGKSPNTNICPVCMGAPGALPVPNKVALEKCIALSLALNCSINKNSKFDRKNYYYPDLPKGYQISQFDLPIGYDGNIQIDGRDKPIRIKRVHLEEDTAKSIHSDSGETLIDYNKSGIPLIEIVTEPDFHSIDELLSFGRRLRQIVRYTNTSDAEMQKGQMRFELNISLKKDSDPKSYLPDYRIEVKNIGSISVLQNVAEFEIARQSALLEKGETIVQETRGLKNMKGETSLQRTKETSDDYRYFPEPDLAPFEIAEHSVEKLQHSLPELPLVRKNRYINLGIDEQQAEIFVENAHIGDWFDDFGKLVDWQTSKVLEGVKWINSELLGLLEKQKQDISESEVNQKDIQFIVETVLDKKITRAAGKQVLEIIVTKGGDAETIVANQNLMVIQDNSEIEKFVDQVIEENQKVVADISKNPNAIKFLLGQVMRLSKGKAKPQVVEEMLQKKLHDNS